MQTLKDRFLQAASDSCAPCMAFPATVTTAQLTHRDLILSLPLEASQLPAGPQFLSGSTPGGQDDSNLCGNHLTFCWKQTLVQVHGTELGESELAEIKRQTLGIE